MDEQTIVGALSRLEDIAGKYGPAVATGLSDLADILGGSTPTKDSSTANPSAPAQSHIAARLHRIADTLQGVFGGIEGHTARARQAVG